MEGSGAPVLPHPGIQKASELAVNLGVTFALTANPPEPDGGFGGPTCSSRRFKTGGGPYRSTVGVAEKGGGGGTSGPWRARPRGIDQAHEDHLQPGERGCRHADRPGDRP